MKHFLAFVYVALSVWNFGCAWAVALGYAPDPSTVAVSAFVGAAGVFMAWADGVTR